MIFTKLIKISLRCVFYLFLSVSVSMLMRVCLLTLLCLCVWEWSGSVAPVSIISCEMMSMGTGNTIVLLFSAEMLFRVWRYLQRWLHNVAVQCSSTIMDRIAADLSCRAAGLSTMTSAASLSALLALCSPSAAITLALASLEQGVRPGCFVKC